MHFILIAWNLSRIYIDGYFLKFSFSKNRVSPYRIDVVDLDRIELSYIFQTWLDYTIRKLIWLYDHPRHYIISEGISMIKS